MIKEHCLSWMLKACVASWVKIIPKVRVSVLVLGTFLDQSAMNDIETFTFSHIFQDAKAWQTLAKILQEEPWQFAPQCLSGSDSMERKL